MSALHKVCNFYLTKWWHRRHVVLIYCFEVLIFQVNVMLLFVIFWSPVLLSFTIINWNFTSYKIGQVAEVLKTQGAQLILPVALLHAVAFALGYWIDHHNSQGRKCLSRQGWGGTWHVSVDPCLHAISGIKYIRGSRQRPTLLYCTQVYSPDSYD